MLSFAEALAQISAGIAPVGTEQTPLRACDGRVLAEDVTADRPLPGFDYSMMDGYALCAASQSDRPTSTIPLQPGEVTPGTAPPVLLDGHAIRIFTGAALPAGANAVVMQEDVTVSGTTLSLPAPTRAGENVRKQGDDLKPGVTVGRVGEVLTPARLALLAALNRDLLYVFARPRVGVLSTGNELRAPGELSNTEGTTNIVDSNSVFLPMACKRLGADVTRVMRVRDDLDETTRAVRALVAECDLVLTIGGVSVGDHDHVRAAFAASGVDLSFYRVAIKPGKPLAVGRAGQTIVMGLPGNPASATLTFLLFAAPTLRALRGEPWPVLNPTELPVVGHYTRKPGRLEFARARLARTPEGRLEAHLALNQASGAVTSFAQADALIMLSPETTEVNTGDRLPVLRIAELMGG